MTAFDRASAPLDITPTNPLTQFCPDDFTVTVTCADGLEQALLVELASFGLVGEVLRAGRVSVRVNLAQFYHLCLYSRVASRVLLPLGEYYFKQKLDNGKEILNEDVPEALYRFARTIDWTAIFGVEQSFAIRLSTDKRLTVNQQFATLRLKDAIADTFNAAMGVRPDVDAKSPDMMIFAAANGKFAEIFLDLSGVSLHRRGYRVANTAAPLKENLAAALLYECGWHTGKFDALIDPMCGSGTFVIEALLMRTNYPIGLEKVSDAFGFYHWQYHDENLWQQAVQHATQTFHHNLENLHNNPITVIAMDASSQAIKASHKNLLAAGLSPILDTVQLEQRTLHHLPEVLSSVQAQHPLIITNPPYGERLGESDFIKPLYQGLGLLAADGVRRAGMTQAYLAVLASHIEHADTLPIKQPETMRCHNGALTVYFRHGLLNTAALPSLLSDFQRKEIDNHDAQEFINRLQKNLANLKKQAKKHGVTNLRVYDADLPNFNVAIDLYGDKIHVQEYAPPKQIPDDVARKRFNLVLAAVREIFGISRESIFIKTRARQSGNEQYTKNENAAKRKKMWLAGENDAYFYVNFTDYLDTGLFIDHRNMRHLVAAASRGKRVLNLFSYTCTASAHAALAGAKTVTSVDLSANYLDWGRTNFALNGLVLDALFEDELKYQFVAADTFEWIKENTEQYDVIFIDPPTFSNSKKFKGTFDVQRDHVALINRAMNRLSSDGVLYFSNNYTRFELDESLSQRYQVIDITDKTIGFDFDIKKPIHRSFEIRHKLGAPRLALSDDDFQAFAAPKPTLESSFTQDDSANKGFNKRSKTGQKPKATTAKSRDHYQDKFNKANGKPSGKSHNKTAKSANRFEHRFGASKFGNKTRAADNAQTPSVKRVYVNPKLADADKLAQSLSDKVQAGEQSTQEKRFKVKKK